MYSPTRCQPAAAPCQASYMRPALYHYAPAPYAPRRYGKARSMAAMLARYSAVTRQRYLTLQAAKVLAGQRPNWPNVR
jgi:hypothetical protein